MSDPLTPHFQVTILGQSPGTDALHTEATPFAVHRHSRDSREVINRINDLESIWDQVITKLTNLADQSSIAGTASQFELDEIEFNVGIEAGLSVGLVTEGDATVSIKCSRKKTGG